MVQWTIRIIDDADMEHLREELYDEDMGDELGEMWRRIALDVGYIRDDDNVYFAVDDENKIIEIGTTVNQNNHFRNSNNENNNNNNYNENATTGEGAFEQSLQQSTHFSPPTAPVNPHTYNDPSVMPETNSQTAEVNSNDPPIPTNTDPISYQGGRRRRRRSQHTKKHRHTTRRKSKTAHRR
jgi:hypothetical protein